MSTYEGMSDARIKYLRHIKKRKVYVAITQILIVAGIIALWEILARLKIIDSFIMNQPSRILKTF